MVLTVSPVRTGITQVRPVKRLGTVVLTNNPKSLTSRKVVPASFLTGFKVKELKESWKTFFQTFPP
ncbi:hypothetical protein Hanom_Chr08g00756391 [Helianthus anomalus]